MPGSLDVNLLKATKQKEFLRSESRGDYEPLELTIWTASGTTGPSSQQHCQHELKLKELELKKRDQDIKMRDQKIKERNQEIQVEAQGKDHDIKLMDQKIKMRDQDLKEIDQNIQIEAQKRDHELKMKDLETKQRNQEIQIELEAQKRDHDLKIKDREITIENLKIELESLEIRNGEQELLKKDPEYRNSRLYIDQIENIDGKIKSVNIREEELIRANTPTNSAVLVGGLGMIGAGVGGVMGSFMGPVGAICGVKVGAAVISGAVGVAAAGVGVAASAKEYMSETDLKHLKEMNRRERQELEAQKSASP